MGSFTPSSRLPPRDHGNAGTGSTELPSTLAETAQDRSLLAQAARSAAWPDVQMAAVEPGRGGARCR